MALVSTTADAGLDHKTAIDRLLEVVRAYFDLPLAIVSAIDGETYSVEHVVDDTKTIVPGDRFDLRETYCERVIALEQPLYVHNASASLFREHPCYESMQLETYVGVRLFVGGRVYGTLNLTAPEPCAAPFSAEDIAVFETAAALISQRIALKEAEARFLLAVQGSSVGLWDWDVHTEELFCSPRFKEIVGLSADDRLISFDVFEDLIHPEDRGWVMDAVKAHLVERKPFDVEYRLRHVNGHYVWIHARGQAVWSPEGMTMRMAGSVDDISARKAADRQLQEQAEALRRSNEELERFAYVTSHDLQEPLRKVRAFGDLLMRDYADRLDARGRKLLDTMVEGAGRMQTLIQDLLGYSRSGHVAMNVKPVDLDALIADVASDFDLALSECGGSIDWQVDGEIQADPVLLRQLIHNLVSNGVKYRDPARAPRISLELERPETGGACLRVSDNGIGFPDEYAARIFQVFQRLHTRGDYPGTGVGLALCQRIAERHGGRIRAEGRPGEGAVFHVELPADPPQGVAPDTEQ